MSIKAWVALALVLACAWLYAGRQNALRELADYKRQVAEANAKVIEQANLDTLIKQRNAERTADEQAARDAEVARQLAAARLAADGLRDEITRLNRRPLPQDPRAAAFAREASAARSALQQCGERYTAMDGAAKSLGSQVIGLQAWVASVCQQNAPAPAQGLDTPAPD